MKMDQRTEHQGPKGKLMGDAATAQNSSGESECGFVQHIEPCRRGIYPWKFERGKFKTNENIILYTFCRHRQEVPHFLEYKWIPKMFGGKKELRKPCMFCKKM